MPGQIARHHLQRTAAQAHSGSSRVVQKFPASRGVAPSRPDAYFRTSAKLNRAAASAYQESLASRDCSMQLRFLAAARMKLRSFGAPARSATLAWAAAALPAAESAQGARAARFSSAR